LESALLPVSPVSVSLYPLRQSKINPLKLIVFFFNCLLFLSSYKSKGSYLKFLSI